MKKIIPANEILQFYNHGLFPMAENAKSDIIKLYQPKKRFIIPIDDFHIPKKLFKLFKTQQYKFKINSNFEKVILKCQKSNRNQSGTWINDIILETYINLHYNNKCHSVECYDGEKLVAGLYGVHIGKCFFGESMFSDVTNASKFCLLYLIAILKKNYFTILDSQFYNEHLVQFGAYEINNESYLQKLRIAIKEKGNFEFIEDFQEVLSLLQPNNHKS